MKVIKLSIGNKIYRLVWKFIYALFFKIIFNFMFRWRVLLRKIFGAKVSWNSRIYPRASIWSPKNLIIHKKATIANDVIIYNISNILICESAVISQFSHLCTASKTYWKGKRDLISKEIIVKKNAWIATDVFIGAGVTIGEGAVILARCTVFNDIENNKVVKLQ